MTKIFKYISILLLLAFVSLFAQDTVKDLADRSDQALQKRDFKTAVDLGLKSLSEAIRLYGDSSSQYMAQLSKVGRIYFTKGDLDNAEKYYNKEKNLVSAIRGTSNPIYARVVNNLSVVYQTLGRNDKIEQMLLESIKIRQQFNDGKDTSYAKSLNNLGQYYYSIGRYPEAESYLVESLEIKKKALGDNNPTYVTSLINLGLLYKAIGNKEKSLEYIKNAYLISSKDSLLFDDQTTAAAIFNLAIIYTELGMKAEAEPLMAKSSNIQSKMMKEMNPASFSTLYNLAQLQISNKNHDEAFIVLEKALPAIKQKLGIAHPLYSKCLKAMGIIKWIKEDYKSAYEYLNETVQLAEQIYDNKNINYANVMHSFGGLLKEMENFDQAEEFYKKAFDIYLFQIDKYFPFYSESEKAKFYSMLKERFDMFNCYATSRLEAKPSLIGDMYNYHISTKGLLLNYVKKMKKTINASNNPELKGKYTEWKNSKEQLSKLFSMSKPELQRLGKDIDSLEKAVNTMEKELSVASSDINKSNDSSSITWKDVQKKLKENEASVEIIRFKYFNKGWSDSTFYAALILTKETIDTPKFVLFRNGNDLDNTYLRNYKNLIKQKFPDKKSYEVYWEPIDAEIKGKDVVYVSLDGVFNNISLNTLRYPDGKYLLDNKFIYIISNTADLARENTRPKIDNEKNNKGVLFGFPKYKMESTKKEEVKMTDLLKSNEPKHENEVSELPGTKIEIEKIKLQLDEKKWTSDVFMEENATEANIKKIKNNRLVHIATHGFFLNNLNEQESREFGVDIEKAIQNPLLRSGLLFAGASNFMNFDQTTQEKDENGILTSYEALNLNLDNVDLIVLSACETGLGQVMNGEGVYGLQRSFQVAGARNMIMSLWTVNDQTTQELMTTFYKNWLGGEEIHKAFYNAQKTLKEIYKDPYYWGAFVIQGEVAN